MNSPMSVDVARKVTTRPEFVAAKDDAGRVKALYEVLFQRAPKADEVRLAREFLTAHNVPHDAPVVASAASAKGPNPDGSRPDRVAGKGLGGRKADSRRAIRNEGEFVARKPLTVWEQYAQALLFANEIAYVN